MSLKLIAALSLFFVCISHAQELRRWTDQKNRTITAELISSVGEKVTIRKENGDAFTVPIQILSEADQAYVRGYAASDDSDGSVDRYPVFSWDHIPRYMHIRKATEYTDEEIAFLARFPLITFEKSNGHQTFGSTEEGTLIAARKVKAINPAVKILYYRNVIVHYGGYAYNAAFDQIPNGLLHDNQGNTQLVRDRVPAYDLSNPEVCRSWVEHCQRMASDSAIDGIFFDGNVKALVSGYLKGEIGEEKKQQVMEGYLNMMEQTRAAIGPDKLMVANILRARFENGGLEYMNFFDGSYLEGFFHNVSGASYEDYVAKGIESMQQAAADGKIIAFTTSLATPSGSSRMGIDEGAAQVESDEEAKLSLIYPLAVFLVAAGEHSYFRVHEGYAADGNDRWMRWFEEYDKPLGAPKSTAKKEGFQYTREFEHASVMLDIQKRTADITWH